MSLSDMKQCYVRVSIVFRFGAKGVIILFACEFWQVPLNFMKLNKNTLTKTSVFPLISFNKNSYFRKHELRFFATNTIWFSAHFTTLIYAIVSKMLLRAKKSNSVCGCRSRGNIERAPGLNPLHKMVYWSD